MLLKFSTALLTEEATQKAVPPFTKIHGHPSRGDRNVLREEALKMLGAVDMPDTKHGLVGELAKPVEFLCITGEEEPYEEPDKPLPYDDQIDHEEMSPEDVKMAEAGHLELLTMWHIRKGTLAGVGEQIPKSLDKNITNGWRKR